MKTRNPELDIVRGIAVYLVVLGHLLDLLGDPAAALNLCHLAVFFFVSGYLLYFSMQRHGARELFSGRIRALIIPYLIWSFVSYAANLFLMYVTSAEMTAERILAEFVDIFLLGRSLWFLIQLFLANSLILLCWRLANHERVFWLLNIGCFVMLCLLLPNEWMQFNLFTRLYVYFIAGFIIAKHPGIRERNNTKTVLALRIILACAYPMMVWRFVESGLYFQMSDKVPAMLIGLLIGADGVSLLFLIAKLLCKTGLHEGLVDIGTYSIDIYVTHMFPVKFVPVQWMLERVSSAVAVPIMAVYAGFIVAMIWLTAKYILRRLRLYRLSVGR